MKVRDVAGKEVRAAHIANPSFPLVVVAMGDKPIAYGGIPAVLRDVDGDTWFSAELIAEAVIGVGQYTAYAVNAYADRNTAQYDAERRGDLT